jgi:hypothetical protein
MTPFGGEHHEIKRDDRLDPLRVRSGHQCGGSAMSAFLLKADILSVSADVC